MTGTRRLAEGDQERASVRPGCLGRRLGLSRPGPYRPTNLGRRPTAPGNHIERWVFTPSNDSETGRPPNHYELNHSMWMS